MTHPTARAIAFASLMGVASTAALAQEIEFKPELKPGATMTYEMKSRLDVSQTQSGTTNEQNVEHNATFEMRVESVDNDGNATMSLTFDAIAMNIKAGGNSEAFSWADNGGDRPTASMGEGLNASGFALAGAKVGFTVSADGQVSGVTGLDGFMETIDGDNATSVAYVGVFTPERFAEAIEPIFDADGGAEEPREKSDRWQDTERVDLGAVGAIVLTRNYSYLQNSEDMAIVMGTLSVKHEKPESPQADAPTVKLSGVQGANALQWNINDGLLQQYGRNETMKTTWTMGDVSVEQMQRSVLTLTRAD